MSRSKTYMCIKFLDLTTEVEVNGVMKVIRFKGGISAPRKVCGSLTTTDPVLQKALENSPAFGKTYVLYKDWGEQKGVNDPVDKPPMKVVPTPPDIDEVHITGPVPDPIVEIPPNPVIEEGPKGPGVDSIVMPDVTSGQKARNFLVGKFEDVKISALRNNEIIRQVAADKNVLFPNWPKE